MKDYIPDEVIHIGRFSLVQRATTRATGEPVILKTCAADHPNASDIARIHNEWRILRDLESPLIVRARALVDIADRPVLVLADTGAKPLRALATGQVDLDWFFVLAQKLGRALESVHAARVVHRDIKPENMLFDPESGEFVLLDFNISIRLSEHRATSEAPELVAGTLPYLAPEQTGRTGQTVDERTDLYGTGVMFYELLGGRLPFVETNPLELIHQHLTATPPPLSSLAPDIPASLCAIVERLMCKNPDERYQSARGLRFDMERAEAAWRAGEDQTFELGERDVSDRLRMPDALYGRGQQMHLLEQASRRTSRGARLMVCVRGAAGSGKSSLVQAFERRHSARGDGLTATGHCDAMQRDVPHKPMVDALRHTLRQILMEDEETIERWTERIKTAVGENAATLTGGVPELTIMLGEPPALPEVGLVESSNRFRDTLHALVQCFARPGHPFTLFIDDLQWADPATLHTLRALLADPGTSDFLIITAFRNDDEDQGRALERTLDAWRDDDIPVERVEVQDLEPGEVTRLLADTLHTHDDPALETLARVVHEKTLGNPFAVRQFLRLLDREGLLVFDGQAMRWTWDQDAIDGADIADNVVERLVARMRELAPEVQEVLMWIACLGSHAGARELLALAADISLAALAGRISTALQHGLLATSAATERLLFSLAQREDASLDPDEISGIDLSFPHDRVRQAAYALIPESRRAREHLRIGRLLFAKMRADATLDDHIFDVIEHFRKGASLLPRPSAAPDDAERARVVALALSAASRSRAANAYQAGLIYARFALSLLPGDPWADHYHEAYQAHRIKAECLSLTGEHAAADASSQKLEKRARTRAEKAALYELRLQQCLSTSAFDRAIELALARLELFDISFPATDHDAAPLVTAELDAILARLGPEPATVLLGLPRTDDPDHVAVVGGFMAFFRIGYLSGRPNFATLGTLRAFSYTLEHGITQSSSYAIGIFGFFAMQFFGHWDLGITMGRVAENLAKENPSPAERALTQVSTLSLLSHWHRPLRNLLPALDESLALARRAGAYETMSYAISAWSRSALLAGHDLQHVRRALSEHFVTIERIRADVLGAWVRSVGRAVATLTGRPLDNMPPATELDAKLNTHVTTELRCALHVPRPSEAIDALIARRDTVFKNGAGLCYTWDVTFAIAFHNLVLAGEARQRQSDGQSDDQRAGERIASARADMATLERWADGGNINLEHKIRLLEAEFARIEGREMDALESYGQAMSQARVMEHPADEALAAERAASLCDARHLSDLTRHYLGRARAAYDRWGATVKVRELDRKLGLGSRTGIGESMANTLTPRSSSDSGAPPTNAFSLGSLDIQSVVKAALAIGQELRLSLLLEALMRVLMENAGADRAALLMTRGGEFIIAAQAHDTSDIEVYSDRPPLVSSWREGPQTVVRYVMRTRTKEVLGDATEHPSYGSDPYIETHQVRSLVCLPIEKQGELIAALYLENRSIPDAFTHENIALLQVLAGQIAISLENARLYSELEEALSDLASNERLKHEFLATVSHELRTPLNAIINMPAVLLACMPSPGGPSGDPQILPGIAASDMRDMLETIHLAGRNLLTLIEGMILFTRLEAGTLSFEFVPLDIERPIDEALDALEPTLVQERATVRIDTSATADARAQVLADPQLLRVIVHHLIDNAIKFSPPGSTIELSTALLGTDIELAVRDPGSGIPEDQLTLIFESFRQGSMGTKRARGGTGLGLTITKKLVNLHGGTIKVRSTPGQGSVFTITLPAVVLPPEPLTLH